MKPHLKSICSIFPSPYLSGNTVLFRKVFILRGTKFFRYFPALSCFCFFLYYKIPCIRCRPVICFTISSGMPIASHCGLHFRNEEAATPGINGVTKAVWLLREGTQVWTESLSLGLVPPQLCGPPTASWFCLLEHPCGWKEIRYLPERMSISASDAGEHGRHHMGSQGRDEGDESWNLSKCKDLRNVKESRAETG